MNQQTDSRISILEKKLKHYHSLNLALLITLTVFTLLSFKDNSPAQEILTVRGLRVVDELGRTVIELKHDKGIPEINALSSSGKKAVSLTATSTGVGNLYTFDNDGDILFKLTSTKGGGGYMALYNSKLSPVLESGITVNEAGYLYLNDRSKKAFFNCTQSSTGGGVLSLLNDGIEAVNLSSPNAGGRIGVFNSSKIRVGYLGAEDNKNGAFALWDADGKRTGLMP